MSKLQYQLSLQATARSKLHLHRNPLKPTNPLSAHQRSTRRVQSKGTVILDGGMGRLRPQRTIMHQSQVSCAQFRNRCRLLGGSFPTNQTRRKSEEFSNLSVHHQSRHLGLPLACIHRVVTATTVDRKSHRGDHQPRDRFRLSMPGRLLRDRQVRKQQKPGGSNVWNITMW
jgi:hypothetical protein